MVRFSFLLLVLSLKFCCFVGQAQSYTLEGRVINYQGRSVDKATVLCYKTSSKLDRGDYVLFAKVQTSSDGRFSFEVDKETTYPLLIAGKSGLALGWAAIDIQSELTPTIRLGRPGILKGTVVDETGNPVPDARVSVYMKNEMMSKHIVTNMFVPEDWYVERTDMQGQFVFEQIPACSTADFSVEAPGKASVCTFGNFGFGKGEQFETGRDDIRIIMPPEGCIKGRIVNEENDRTLNGIDVQIKPYDRSKQDFYKNSVKTDLSGRFEFTKLPPDKYLLWIVANEKGYGSTTIVLLESNRVISDVEIVLKRGIPFEVVVCDLEKGEPLGDAKVTVKQKDASTQYVTFSRTVITDANGLAKLHVPPGECGLEVTKIGHGTTLLEQYNLTIDARQTPHEEVFLRRTSRVLSGEVLDEQGRAISGASVLQRGFGPRTLTDTNGRFDTGNMSLFTSSSSKVQVFTRHTTSGLAATTQLEDPNDTGNFHGRIILKPAYVLTGRVTNPDGNGIPAACVRLLEGINSTLIAEVFTDANGVYSINSVPPPEDRLKYFVVAQTVGYGMDKANYIPFNENMTQPVQLDPIVLLPANRTISGVVQDSNEQPVANVHVSVYGPEIIKNYGKMLYGTILTDAKGRFRIEGVCKEPLEIKAWVPTGRKQNGKTWVNGANENVKVILGQELHFVSSLLGEFLPEFDILGIDLSLAEVNDKMVLVCFFDMNQRPSRRCILEINKQVEGLKQKGVTIVAVHASKIEKNTLDDWLKEKNISFPTGMIQNEAEKTKFAWGVRALPWLILTDSKHIVRAEGFGINELNAKIGELADAED